MTGADDERPDGALLIRALAAHEAVVADPVGSGAAARAVLLDAQQAGSSEALVVALRAVAWLERSQLENLRALGLLRDAARIAQRESLPHRLGEVLVTRAAVNLELGRMAAARRDLDRADDLTTSGHALDVRLTRAVLLCNVGRIADGADILRDVLVTPGAMVDVRARAAINLALAESLLGNSRDALRYIDLASTLAPQVGPSLVAYSAQNRGVVLAQAGRLADGLRQFDEATVLLAQAGLPLGECYAEQTETFMALRALPEARDLGRRAVDELAGHDVPLMAAEARLRLAEIALLTGDLSAAWSAADRAVGEFRRQRRTGWSAQAVVLTVEAARQLGVTQASDVGRVCRAADSLARLGRLSAAVDADVVAGRVARSVGRDDVSRRRWLAAYERSRTGAVLVRVQGRVAGALAAAVDGDDAAVLGHCRAGLGDLGAHRAALASMELRAMASGHGTELGQLGLGVLLRSGRPSQVFDWTERTRAAALLPVGPPAPESLHEEHAALAALRLELAEARRGTGVEPAELLARQTAGESRIRRATWGRTASGSVAGPTRTAREIRDLLDDRVLVSYVRHGSDILAVVVERHRSRVVPLGALAPLRFEADALLFALRRLTRPGRVVSLDSARASADHALDQLRRLVVGPLGIDPEGPLVVVPTGDTHRVAWSALHRGPVSVAPSATAWADTRRRAAGASRVVVVAGPDLDGVTAEVAAVASCHPGALTISPPDATIRAVLQAMGDAELVHLACHGVLRADNPIFSALVMADGPLTVHELDLNGVAPPRIVLASCDSAADASYAGDEVLGFVGALLSRGTAGLVASIVPVGDAESIALMKHLHIGLAHGLSMSDALHRARARLDRSDPRQFVNWCGFTAYGAG